MRRAPRGGFVMRCGARGLPGVTRFSERIKDRECEGSVSEGPCSEGEFSVMTRVERM